MTSAVRSVSCESPLLEARNLYRFFHAGDDEVLALRGVSMSVEAGEMVAVVGPSGSGKSTLLSCLAGIDEPDGGAVYLGARRISRLSETERTRLRREWIGMLFQSGNLFDHLDLAANIAFVQRLAGKVDRVWSAMLVDTLGLTGRLGSFPSQLSGGELARAGLAVALANDPPVVLADEPTGELDSLTEGDVVELLRSESSRERAVVVVTHSAAVASRADRVVPLLDGQMAKDSAQ